VVVIIAAVQERFIDALLRFLDEAFPDGIPFLGWAKSEEPEGGVGEAVFGGGLGEHLRGDAAGGEIDEVVAFQGGLPGGAIKLTEGVGHMAWLVWARLFSVGGKNGAVGLDGIEIMA